MFAFVIFLGAFLLFHVQPLIAKYILPWFGSTPAVWTTCMLFFQVLLLGGYAYAHALTYRARARQQFGIHAAMLALALGVLALQGWRWGNPLLPGDSWKVFSAGRPQGHLLLLLLCSVGLPYFILATTNPLLQKWFTTAHPTRSPYPLYALSNLGSLLGLLGYPALVERLLPLTAQARWVSGLFVLYAAMCISCAWWNSRTNGPRGSGPSLADQVEGRRPRRPDCTEIESDRISAAYPPTRGLRLLWLLLAMCGSMLLLAVTNQVCEEVAVVPLLWVVPLSLYLMTFMLAFSSGRFYRRSFWLFAVTVSTALACLSLLNAFRFSLPSQIVIYGGLLFSTCMFCHGEIARTRPSPAHLTEYYLLIAAGGAMGGLLVGLLAPVVFSGFWEFHTSIACCGFLVLVVLVRDRASGLHHGSRVAAAMLIIGASLLTGWIAAPFLLPPVAALCGEGAAPHLYYGAAGLLGLLFLWLLVRRPPASGLSWQRPIWSRVALACAFFALEVTLGYHVSNYGQSTLFQARNFYGVVRVRELENEGVPMQTLIHGRVIHGMQFKDPAQARRPTSYFVEQSGVGLALRAHPRRALGNGALRVGVVGLGVGTVAAYVGTNDVMRFYEINPMVASLSEGTTPLFTFLRDAPGRVQIVLGDARLEMERELREGGGENYDVLVLDAFSSDAIPVHLLTREAFALYLKHLRAPDSILALHCSNRVLDLLPVARANARACGLAHIVVTQDSDGPHVMRSDWVLFARDPNIFQGEPFATRASKEAASGREVAWTDGYSSLFDVLIK